MKALLVFICFFCVSVFGQSSKIREVIRSDPRFAFAPKQEFTSNATSATPHQISKFIFRKLDDKLIKDSLPKDSITLGIMSMAENFGVNDISSGALSLRTNDDGSFRFRSSKILYRYNPRVLPHDPWVVLDRLFAQPVKFLASKTLSF